MATYRKVFTAASANAANWFAVPISFGDGWTGTSAIGDQIAKITATISTNNDATLAVALVDGGDYVSGTYTYKGIVEYVEYTCSVQTRRTGFDNASGDYTMKVSSTITNLNKFDMLGTGKLHQADGSEIDNDNERRYLLIGCPTLAAGTLTVDVTTTRAI